jgi:hypothetical protein
MQSGRANDASRARSLLEQAATAARHFELSGLIPKIEAQLNELRRNGTPNVPREPAQSARGSTAPPPLPDPANNGARYVFQHEGEFWTLHFDREMNRLKHARGLQLIATLLRNPGVQVHALELATGENTKAFRTSSAGSVLDAKARSAYKERLQELVHEQAEAEAHNDAPRAARARQETEALTQQLGRALGIGGRNRRTAAEAERARINVTRSIRSAISRMKAKSPGLAHHLSTSIRTGSFCHYVPDPSRRIEWQL